MTLGNLLVRETKIFSDRRQTLQNVHMSAPLASAGQVKTTLKASAAEQASSSARTWKWDIRDSVLPEMIDADEFDAWPEGPCKRAYSCKQSVEAARHSSGWAMRNTNNHNVNILKKSCLGVLVCSKHCHNAGTTPGVEGQVPVYWRPAICDKARNKQIGQPCRTAGCSGMLQLQRCQGRSGYPVTHFWRSDGKGHVFFQSKGTHNHPKPIRLYPLSEGRKRSACTSKSRQFQHISLDVASAVASRAGTAKGQVAKPYKRVKPMQRVIEKNRFPSGQVQVKLEPDSGSMKSWLASHDDYLYNCDGSKITHHYQSDIQTDMQTSMEADMQADMQAHMHQSFIQLVRDSVKTEENPVCFSSCSPVKIDPPGWNTSGFVKASSHSSEFSFIRHSSPTKAELLSVSPLHYDSSQTRGSNAFLRADTADVSAGNIFSHCPSPYPPSQCSYASAYYMPCHSESSYSHPVSVLPGDRSPNDANFHSTFTAQDFNDSGYEASLASHTGSYQYLDAYSNVPYQGHDSPQSLYMTSSCSPPVHPTGFGTDTWAEYTTQREGQTAVSQMLSTMQTAADVSSILPTSDVIPACRGLMTSRDKMADRCSLKETPMDYDILDDILSDLGLTSDSREGFLF